MTCDLCIPCLEGSPFLNLSAEGPEPFFFRALGWCCDGEMLEYESLVSYADAQTNILRMLQTDCPVCAEPQKFCADATCPDGTVLTTVCVTTSQLDADAIAQAKSSSMAPYCASGDFSPLFSATCSCPNGANPSTVYSDLSQAVADAECAAIPKDCNSTEALSANEGQTCVKICSDGTPFTYSILPGSFFAATLEEANAIAYSFACALAFEHLKCCNMTASLANGTVGTAYAQIVTSSLTNPVWSVSSGALPPGLTLDSSTGIISGTPTTAGTYTFTIEAVQ